MWLIGRRGGSRLGLAALAVLAAWLIGAGADRQWRAGLVLVDAGDLAVAPAAHLGNELVVTGGMRVNGPVRPRLHGGGPAGPGRRPRGM